MRILLKENDCEIMQCFANVGCTDERDWGGYGREVCNNCGGIVNIL